LTAWLRPDDALPIMHVRRFAGALLAAAVTSAVTPAGSHADGFLSPDIFVLGDSQITFGAGQPLVDLFKNLAARCAPHWRDGTAARELAMVTVGVMGIRSTSVHALVARTGRAKALVCEKDKKWGVNAGSYGALRVANRKFEQVGEHPHNQFCREGQSPLEAMFADGYYAPRLLVLYFLGNSAQRWANEPELLARDVAQLTQQLPEGLPCVFTTTAPSYTGKRNALRRKAQLAFQQALSVAGQRCEFVAGITPETTAEFEGNARHYYKKKSGEVRDPTHLNATGARRFLALRTAALCRAVERATDAQSVARD
jgi:hypothetical protein